MRYRAFIVLLGLTCALPVGAAPRPPCLTLVSTNDLHGTIETREHRAGQHAAQQGGLLALSGYVRILRQRFADQLLLLDAGDLYQGTLVSNHFEGKPMVQALATMGFAATVIGNHEFDFGAGRKGGSDLLAVVKQRALEAPFPFLGLNVFEKASGKRIAWRNTAGSRLREVNGVKVGIIGLATEETARTTKPENVASLDFRAPRELVVAEAKALRKAGAKLVIVVGHMGSHCDELGDAEDASSCDLNGELLMLLMSLPRGAVDIAVGGHTHREIAHWVNGVATVEASPYARSFSRVDACLAPGGGLDRERTTIHVPQPVCLTEWREGGCSPRHSARGVRPATYLGSRIEPMPELATAMRPYVDEVARMNAELLGVSLAAPLERGEAPTSLGVLVAESMARAGGTPLAVQNLGGVRDDLPAGELRFGQLFAVLPFGNELMVLELTGAELRAAIETLYAKRGGTPYLWGLRVVKKGDAIDVQLADGKPLAAAQTYRITMTDFLATGGDGLDQVLGAVEASRRHELGVVDRDAMLKLLRERFPAR